VNYSLLYRQKGFSLIEALLATMVAGVVSVGVLSYVKNKTDDNKRLESDSMVKRAHASLQAYILLNSKLPCPAPDANGVASDDCHKFSGNITGYLPYKTLGLPDVRAGKISYSINNGKNGSLSLTQVPQDSLKILSVSHRQTIYQPPSVIAASKGFNSSSDGFLNFCAALISSADTKTLPAYELFFKDTNYSLSFFNDPLITTRSTLFQKFHCASLLSGAARTHANTSLGVHMMYFAAKDVSEYAGIRLEEASLKLKERLIMEVLEYSVFLVEMMTKKVAKTADATSKATSKPLTTALEPLKQLNLMLKEVQFWLARAQDIITITREIAGVAELAIQFSQSLLILQSTHSVKNTTDVNLYNSIFAGLELPRGSYASTPPPPNGMTPSAAARLKRDMTLKVLADIKALTIKLSSELDKPADQRNNSLITQLSSEIDALRKSLQELIEGEQYDAPEVTADTAEIKSLRAELKKEQAELERLSAMQPNAQMTAEQHAQMINNQAEKVAKLQDKLNSLVLANTTAGNTAANSSSSSSSSLNTSEATTSSSLNTEASNALSRQYIILLKEYDDIQKLQPTATLSREDIDKMARSKLAQISAIANQISALQQ
jgi:type II secretory pathway pseudopilin PulG